MAAKLIADLILSILYITNISLQFLAACTINSAVRQFRYIICCCSALSPRYHNSLYSWQPAVCLHGTKNSYDACVSKSNYFTIGASATSLIVAHTHTLAHTLLHWQFMSFLIENLNLKRHGKAFICAVVNVTGTGTGAGLALPPS